MALLYLLAGALSFAGFYYCERRDWAIGASLCACFCLFFTMMGISCLSDMKLFGTH